MKPPVARAYTVSEVRFKVVRERPPLSVKRYRINGPDDAVRFARQTDTFTADDAREHFAVAMLDAQNGVVAWHEISHGTLSASPVSPREVFGAALMTPGTASVVLFHNHPSGDPTPSREDQRLTRDLAEAGKLLDIGVQDHVILGDGTDAFQSLAQRGCM